MRLYAPEGFDGESLGIDLFEVASLEDGDLMVAGRASPELTLAGAPIAPHGAFVARLTPDGRVKWMRSCDSIHVALTVDSEHAYVAFATTTRGVPGEPPSGLDFDDRALTLSAFSLTDGAPVWSTQAPAKGERPYVWGVTLAIASDGALVAAVNLAEVSSLGDIPLGVEQTSSDLLVSWWGPRDGSFREATLVAGHDHLLHEDLVALKGGRLALFGSTRGPLTVGGEAVDEEGIAANESGYIVMLVGRTHAWTRRLHGERLARAVSATATDEGLVVAALFDGIADFTRGVVGRSGTNHVVFMGMGEDGATLWERVGTYEQGLLKVNAMIDVGGGEVAAAIAMGHDADGGGLDLGGLHYATTPGMSGLLVRVGADAPLRPIERWSTADDDPRQLAHEAQPFAMTLHHGALVAVGKAAGSFRIGEEALALPGGAVDPCASSIPPSGVQLARVFIDPCKPQRWHHWGGVLRTITSFGEPEAEDAR